MKVRYSYLPQQFAEPAAIFDEMRKLVATGDFTLGEPVGEFERRFAAMIGVKHAIGVGSGTDSLKLALKATSVGHGDEVITAANTFVASVGAISKIGAIPVLVDADDSFCLAPDKLEAATAEGLGYKRGQFPVTERQADRILTLPIHQFLSTGDLEYVAETVNGYYGAGPC